MKFVLLHTKKDLMGKEALCGRTLIKSWKFSLENATPMRKSPKLKKILKGLLQEEEEQTLPQK